MDIMYHTVIWLEPLDVTTQAVGIAVCQCVLGFKPNTNSDELFSVFFKPSNHEHECSNWLTLVNTLYELN